MKKEKYLRICPICGSTDTSYDLSTHAAATRFSTSIYKCNECGYSAQAFPEMDEKTIKEFRKELKKKTNKN